jgi:hypothetical protein
MHETASKLAEEHQEAKYQGIIKKSVIDLSILEKKY